MKRPCRISLVRFIIFAVVITIATSCASSKYAINEQYPQLDTGIEYQGILEERFYDCSVDGPKQRRMFVYLPKDYYANDAAYPVLYLLHGARGNELSWITKGNILHNIDSLTLSGKMKDMIVVFPNVNQYDDDVDFGKSRIKGAVESLFETDGLVEASFVNDVVSVVDSSYRTIPQKNSRAIAGLSIGAMQAIHISANAPDTFDYIGLFSSMLHPVLRKSEYSSFYKGLKDKHKVQFLQPPQLYSIMIGRRDFYYPKMKSYARYLKRNGYAYEMDIVSGGHQWYNWIDFANLFMQKL